MITRRKALTLTAVGLAAGGTYGLTRSADDGGAFADFGAANAQGTTPIEDLTLGDADAPVKVIEYASFTCPHCADFHTDTFKDFKEQYIDTGKVHFTYREVFFDRYGLWAAMIARCAGPDRYFGVADILYETQGEWARGSDASSVAASLKRIGAQAGLSPEQADACLQDAEKAQSLVAWYEANAADDNVTSTPSFVVNGEIHAGNIGLSKLGALVDEAG